MYVGIDVMIKTGWYTRVKT